MNATRILSLAAAAALALAAAAHADTLATWSLANTLEGSTTLTDALTVGDISAGSAVSKPSTSANGISGENWTSASRNENAYFQFTVTATTDYYLKPGDLALNLRSTSKGPPHVEIRHSLNGTSWTTTGTLEVPLDGEKKGHLFSLDFPDITVNSGQELSVRIYAWGAEQAGGTFRLGNGSPMTLSGTAVGTKLPPTIVFPNEAETVSLSNKLTVAIGVLPEGGIKSWTFEPTPAGTRSLSGKTFTFTPKAADVGTTFTLSVTATNSHGESSATLPVTVTEYVPEGVWLTGFENGPNPGNAATNLVIDGRPWSVQQLTFNNGSIPKFGNRACVFGTFNESFMVSREKLLDAAHGFGTVAFWYAAYPGESEPCQPLVIEVATDLDAGNWMEIGRINPTGVDEMTRAEFTLGTSEPVYLRIRDEYVYGSGRVVIDQLAVTPYQAPDWTPYETFLLKYNVTPGDPGSAESDDFDEDGYTNKAEFDAKPQTNPYDKTSHP